MANLLLNTSDYVIFAIQDAKMLSSWEKQQLNERDLQERLTMFEDLSIWWTREMRRLWPSSTGLQP